MPVPFLAAVAVAIAKAPALIKAGRELVDEWNALPAGQRELVSSQAGEVLAASTQVKDALGQKVGFGDRKASKQIKIALSPAPNFVMAVRIVDSLRESGPVSFDGLAKAVGAVGTEDSIFVGAVRIASSDGFMILDGETARPTALADGTLDQDTNAVSVAAGIEAAVTEHRVTSRRQLAKNVGVSGADAPEFLAGLERALTSGTVVWSGPGLFSVPLEELTALATREHGSSGLPTEVDARVAVANLSAAVSELGRSIAAVKDGKPPPASSTSISSHAGESSSRHNTDDVARQISSLAELHDSGVLTDEEFASAKAELLRRM